MPQASLISEVTTTRFPDQSAVAYGQGWSVLLSRTEGDPTFDWSVQLLDRAGALGIQTLHQEHAEAWLVFDDLAGRLMHPGPCPLCCDPRQCPCWDTWEESIDERLKLGLRVWTQPEPNIGDVPY